MVKPSISDPFRKVLSFPLKAGIQSSDAHLEARFRGHNRRVRCPNAVRDTASLPKSKCPFSPSRGRFAEGWQRILGEKARAAKTAKRKGR
jgi:hypothetical protein